jgi:signal transduction histidine kinase
MRLLVIEDERRLGENIAAALDLEEYRCGLAPCLADYARLEDLVPKLLTFARLEQSSPGELISSGQTILSESLREIAAQLDSLATLRGVDLKLNVKDNIHGLLPHEECANPAFNLVLNGLQHTSSGGSVTPSTEATENMVRMEIADTGEGVDPADLPFVFNRFYRGDRSRARMEEPAWGWPSAKRSWLLTAEKSKSIANPPKTLLFFKLLSNGY